jgi:hypothetical protein
MEIAVKNIDDYGKESIKIFINCVYVTMGGDRSRYINDKLFGFEIIKIKKDEWY